MKSHRVASGVVAASLLCLAGFAVSAGEETKSAPAAAPAAIGLKVGDKAPAVMVMNAKGEKQALADMYAKAPLVVVFYRGGWCPYCTKSLEQWDGQLEALKASGATMVAITPEKPEFTTQTVSEKNLDFTVVSDADGSASRGFGLLFSMDDATKQKYLGYGVDLAKRNNDGQWNLPHPGTFVIDTKGVIRYASASADYSTRADPAEVIAAVKTLK
jgi:peroxiredoxin